MIIEGILKEIRRKFSQLKVLLLTNSLNRDEAAECVGKLIFSINLVIAGSESCDSSISQSQLDRLQALKEEVLDFQKQEVLNFKEVETEFDIVGDFQKHLPERIHSDSITPTELEQ